MVGSAARDKLHQRRERHATQLRRPERALSDARISPELAPRGAIEWVVAVDRLCHDSVGALVVQVQDDLRGSALRSA